MFRDFTKYEVYSDGRIWSYSHKKFLKPITNKNGYQLVHLTDNEGNAKFYQLHRVVYESVTGSKIPEGLEVNHISEDKTENFFANLNLLTHKQNINYGTGIKRSAKARINGKRSKAVGAFKNDELVMVFPSLQEAGRQGFYQGNIYACCNGKRKTHKGYTWKYIN